MMTNDYITKSFEDLLDQLFYIMIYPLYSWKRAYEFA